MNRTSCFVHLFSNANELMGYLFIAHRGCGRGSCLVMVYDIVDIYF